MKLDFENHRIILDKEYIYLTKTENMILKILYDRKNQVVNYDEITRILYNTKSDNSSKIVIKKHISSLKKKTGNHIRIRNISKLGYIIEIEKDKEVNMKQEQFNQDKQIQNDFTFDEVQEELPF